MDASLYPQLKTEIETDPGTAGANKLGYQQYINSGSDQKIADLLNAPRTGVVVFSGRVDPSDIASCFLASEVAGLTAANRDIILGMLSLRSIDTDNANMRKVFLDIFTAANQPTTRAALTAKFSRQGSRAEELWGRGVTVTDLDVAIALRG